MKLIKKILKAILILLGLSILICLCIIPFDNKARKEIMEMPINNVNLGEIKDGKYLGNFKNQLRIYDVEVTVYNHNITSIRPVNNSPANSYSNKLFNMVIKQQKINVDTISGATVTSKMILKAIENALNRKEILSEN
jgi:uncharacterized protein with FMN-binding domain